MPRQPLVHTGPCAGHRGPPVGRLRAALGDSSSKPRLLGGTPASASCRSFPPHPPRSGCRKNVLLGQARARAAPSSWASLGHKGGFKAEPGAAHSRVSLGAVLQPEAPLFPAPAPPLHMFQTVTHTDPSGPREQRVGGRTLPLTLIQMRDNRPSSLQPSSGFALPTWGLEAVASDIRRTHVSGLPLSPHSCLHTSQLLPKCASFCNLLPKAESRVGTTLQPPPHPRPHCPSGPQPQLCGLPL